MVEIPFGIEDNIRQYGDHVAIVAPQKGRLLPVMLMSALFLFLLWACIGGLQRIVSEGPAKSDAVMMSVFVVSMLVTGFVTFSWIRQFLLLNEVLLLPEERKIVLRRERTKKVVAEHAIDDVELRDEKAHHEDMSRNPMIWFTLYDTRLQRQIFAIRPTGQGGDGMAVGELKEYFREVMRPGAKSNG
jgi:hypothetical protein